MTDLAHTPDPQMPPHNLLVHVVGYADRGCRACDWLRERGHLPAPSQHLYSSGMTGGDQ